MERTILSLQARSPKVHLGLECHCETEDIEPPAICDRTAGTWLAWVGSSAPSNSYFSEARDCYTCAIIDNIETSTTAQSHRRHSTRERYREAKVDVTEARPIINFGMMAATRPSQAGWLFLTCLTPVSRIFPVPKDRRNTRPYCMACAEE
jgi:hypothetical protein